MIKSNKQWVFAGVFADKAITGTKTDKREEFQLLIQECLSGNIDLVIAKSIPRFARNTLDTLKYVNLTEEYLKVSSKKLLSVVTMKMERKIPIKSFSYIKQDSKMKLETQKNDLGRNQKQ